jgi:hypothetical protein
LLIFFEAEPVRECAQVANSTEARKTKFCYVSGLIRRRGPDGSGQNSGQVDNLTRLRSWNHSLEVCVFTAFKGSFLTFSRALDATLLLLLLFLSAGAFSLAFVHAFSS